MFRYVLLAPLTNNLGRRVTFAASLFIAAAALVAVHVSLDENVTRGHDHGMVTRGHDHGMVTRGHDPALPPRANLQALKAVLTGRFASVFAVRSLPPRGK